MTPARKRGRNTQEDETEFMPLSKRINNLHINTNMLLDQQENPNMTNGMNDVWGPGLPCPSSAAATNLPDSPPLSVQSVDWNPNIPGPYNPELTERQNPHYYSSNKLLYEMYIARHERTNH